MGDLAALLSGRGERTFGKRTDFELDGREDGDMLRAAMWTAGLFAIGAVICHFFSGPFTEPLVLLALGASLFLVSGRAPSSAPKVSHAGPTKEDDDGPVGTPRPESA